MRFVIYMMKLELFVSFYSLDERDRRIVQVSLQHLLVTVTVDTLGCLAIKTDARLKDVHIINIFIYV